MPGLSYWLPVEAGGDARNYGGDNASELVHRSGVLKPFLAVVLPLLIAGCASGAPPNAAERFLYNVTTQRVEVVVLRTNITPTATNVVAVPAFIEIPILDTKEGVATGVQTAGAMASTFGFGGGGIIASLVLSILGAYAGWKNTRLKKLAATMGQNIATGRETILATAGPATEAEYVEAIKSAQIKAGVKAEAEAIVDNKVDAKEARFEAESVVSLAKTARVNKP